MNVNQSRAEILKIAEKILNEAEQERLASAEYEADRGIQMTDKEKIDSLVTIIYMLLRFTNITCVQNGTFGRYEYCKIGDMACQECFVCKKIWETVYNGRLPPV